MTEEIKDPVVKIVEKGTCVSPMKLLDYNCEGCEYFNECTNSRKGKHKKRKKN